MKPNEFDLRIIQVICALRVRAKEKQANLASILQVSQPEYSRIEKGERALTIGHLNIICQYLNVSILQVLISAETNFDVDLLEHSPNNIVARL